MLDFLWRQFGADVLPRARGASDAAGITLPASSDCLLAISCLAMAGGLVVLLRRRRDITFRSTFLLLVAFMLGCAATHALNMPMPQLLGPLAALGAVVKTLTALAAAATAVLFLRLLPTLFRLPNASALQREIAERERIEHEIRDINRYLELRVIERTNELERTNLRLVENELRLRSILDGASALVFVKDMNGRYTFVNQAFCTTVGYARQDILGHTVEDLFPEELASVYRENDRRALCEGMRQSEEPGRSRGVDTIYLSSRFPLLDFDGNPYAICGMLTDVTERRQGEKALLQAHEELRNSEERLRQVMDLLPDMLWSANLDTSSRFISQRYLDYTGYTVKQLENSGYLALFHPEDAPRIEANYQKAVNTGDPAELEVRIRRHDGVYRWFLWRIVPVWNENFQVEYLIGAVTDIHELKRTEQALRRSNEELEQFAYAAAHDLQEPLRNISTSLGMLERLIADRITPEESEWIHKTIENAVRMQAMVKDLLQYSRAVSDQETSHPPVSAEAALQTALANLSDAISESGARINMSGLREVPVREQHLVLLFQNLISNSLKYRKPDDPPDIVVSINDNDSECEFVVSDNGIGFDPIYADRIFKVFKRLHNRDEYAGNGIGLAICARIVAHYGGRIWADAIPGHGATFRFTLPAHRK